MVSVAARTGQELNLTDMQPILNSLLRYGIELDNNEIDLFINAVMDIHNNLELWENNGWTPNELWIKENFK